MEQLPHDSDVSLHLGLSSVEKVLVEGLDVRLPLHGDPRYSAVEPIARISWADPDTNTDDDEGIVLTPGIALHLTGRNMLVANVDVWSPSTGDTEWSFKFQSFLHF